MKRRDRCRDTVTCPRCGAPRGRPCYEVKKPYSGHVYPPNAMKQAIANATHAGMSSGKTMVNTAHVIGQVMRTDWGREMGGLHKARWQAEPDCAVDALAEVVREA